MVSVKGGSKGCNRCRERKVKCDQTRPNCLRCQKYKIDSCPGYVRPIQFVSHTLYKGKGRSNDDTTSDSESPTSSSSDSSSPTSPDVEDRVVPQPVERAVVLKHIPASVHIPDLNICINSLLNRCSLSSRAADDKLPFEVVCQYYASLDLQHVKLTAQGTVEETALVSGAIAFCGRATANKMLQREGAKMYNILLRKLQAGLVDSNGSWRASGFFHACVMATAYEIFVSKDPKSWLKHAAGLSKLVEARGVHGFSSESDTNLYISMRFPMAMYSLDTCTPCFMAGEAWQSLSWMKKALFETLLDKVVILPGLLYDVKQPYIDTNLDLVDRTAEKAINLIHDLLAWRAHWDVEHPLGGNTIYEVPSTSFQVDHHHDENGSLFETFLSYQSISVARSVVVYDTAMLRLIHLVETLLSFGTSPRLNHEWERLSTKMRDRIYTDEVCRTIPFLIQSVASRPGNVTTLLMMLLLAGRTTYVMVDGSASREGRFLERVVQFVTTATGSAICAPVIDRDLSSF